MDRTRPAWEILLSKTKIRHAAVAQNAKLHVLNAQGTLKGVQLDLSVPKLDERQARPRENQSLDLCYWREALRPVVTLVVSRDEET